MNFFVAAAKIIGYKENLVEVELLDTSVKKTKLECYYFATNTLIKPQFKKDDVGIVISVINSKKIGNDFYFLGAIATEDAPTPEKYEVELFEDYKIQLRSNNFLIDEEEDTLASLSKDGLSINLGSDGKLEVFPDKIILNGGSNGGLVKVSSIVQAVNDTRTQLNNILIALKGIVIPPGGGALAGFFPQNPMTPVQVADVENSKIKH